MVYYCRRCSGAMPSWRWKKRPQTLYKPCGKDCKEEEEKTMMKEC